MSEIIFADKSQQPTDTELYSALGKASTTWQEFRNYIEETYGPLTNEWKLYSVKYGWTLKVLKKKRNLLFFSARKDFFIISFIFGDKAVAAAEQSNLPQEIITELVNARKYAEGRGILLEVKEQSQIEYLKELIRIKIEN